MAFALTARLNILPPSNLNSLVSKINSQLKGIKGSSLNNVVSVSPQAQRDIVRTEKGLKNLSKAAGETVDQLEKIGRATKQALTKYFGFVIFTQGFLSIGRSIGAATKEAIDFQREIVKIRQITGTSTKDLGDLVHTVTELSTGLGVSSKKILNVAQTLAQAGFTADEVKKSLTALAKTELAPTFDNINSTTEGAIALMAQFKIKSEDLEKSLGSLNAVAAKFAVESGDIVAAIKRAGASFSSAGDDLNKLVAVFTAIRSTTRESAETIATGLRTITTRLQRTKTIEYLENLGISLRDAKGNFVGMYEAARVLNAALEGTPQNSPRFSAIIEEIGGFRQVNKVIPFIKEFNKAEQAYIVAQRGANSLTKDAESAQEALAIQIVKVKEEFQALIRTIAGNDVFQGLTRGALVFASAIIKLTTVLEPLLPLIGGLALGQVIKAAPSVIKGFTKPSLIGKANGGLIGGQGNKDNVPALLTPGEFVINKKAVQKIGVHNLAKMNSGGAKKFAAGGPVGFSANNLGASAIGLAILPQLVNSFTKLNSETKDMITTVSQVGATFGAVIISLRQAQSLTGTHSKEKLEATKSLQQQRLSGIRDVSGQLKDRLKQKAIEDFEAQDKKNALRLATQTFNTQAPIIGTQVGRNQRLAEREAKIQSRLSVQGTPLELKQQLPEIVKQKRQAEIALAQARKTEQNARDEYTNRRPELLAKISAAQQEASTLPNSPSKKQLNQIVEKTTQELQNLQSGAKSAIDERKRIEAEKNARRKQLRDTSQSIISQELQQKFENKVRVGQTQLGNLKEVVNRTDAARGEAVKRQKLGQIEEKALTKQLESSIKGHAAADKLIKSQERWNQGLNAANVSLAVFSAGAIALGNQMERIGGAQLSQGLSSGQSKFVRGRALSGAGQGLGVGGTIGGLIGGGVGAFFGGVGAVPGAAIGTSVGGVLGAGVGGAVGGSSGSREAKAILDRAVFERSNKVFTQLLGNVSSGASTPLSQVGGFKSGVRGLVGRLRSANPEDKETAQGTIGNAVVGINEFLNKIAKGVKSFEELEGVVGGDVIEAFAQFTELPLKQVRQQFIAQIEAQNKALKISASITQEEVQQLQRLRDFNLLGAALNDTVDSLKLFSGQIDIIEGAAGGGFGRTSVQDISGVFGRGEGVIDRNLLGNAIGQTTSIFGGRADVIGKEFLQISEVLNRLPDILIQTTAKPFGEADELPDEFRKAIKEAFPGISDNIVQTLSANLLAARGQGGTDQNIIRDIKQNPANFGKKLGEGLIDASQKFFEDNSKLLNQHINDLAGLYEKRRNIEAAIVDSLNSTVDLQQQRAEFGFTARNRPVPLDVAQGFENDRAANVFGRGPSNPAAIGVALEAAKNSLLKKNIDLQTAELAGKEKLLSEIEDEKTKIERLSKSLNFLANVSDRNANLTRELERVQQGNRAKFDLAKNFAFGGPDERRGIVRGGIGAGFLAGGGDIDKLHPELRQGGLSFLEGFGDTKLGFLGDKSGNDVIRDTIEKFLKGIGATDKEAKEIALNQTTPAEQKLIDDIDKNFKIAVAATQEQTKQLKDGTNKILNEIAVNTKNFSILLEKNLLSTDKTKLEEQAGRAKAGEISALGEGNIFNQIKGLAGFNITSTNFGNLKNAVPSLVNLANQKKELASGGKLFEGLREFSAGRGSGNDFTDKTLKELAGISITAPGGLGNESGVLSKLDRNKVLSDDELVKSQDLVRSKFGDDARSQIFNQDFNKAFTLGKDSRGQFAQVLQERIQKVIQERLTKGSDTAKQEKELADKFGVAKLPSALLDNADKLNKLFNSLPADTTFEGLSTANQKASELSKKFSELKDEISLLEAIIRTKQSIDPARQLARGGTIPGQGNTDSVPAMLTPGEFVINKRAAEAIGYDELHAMNAQGFATGGRARRREAMGYRTPSQRAEGRLTIADRRSAMGFRGYNERNNVGRQAELATYAMRRNARVNIAHDKSNRPPLPMGQALMGKAARREFENNAATIRDKMRDNKKVFADNLNRVRATQTKGIQIQLRSGRKFAEGGQVQAEKVSEAHMERLYKLNPNLRARPASGNSPMKGGKWGSSSARFASGGAVGGNNVSLSADISAAFNRFATTANQLGAALNNFPRVVEFNARHTVEIIHNGAQMFAALAPAVQTLVVETTTREMNRMLKTKFPGAGIME